MLGKCCKCDEKAVMTLWGYNGPYDYCIEHASKEPPVEVKLDDPNKTLHDWLKMDAGVKK